MDPQLYQDSVDNYNRNNNIQKNQENQSMIIRIASQSDFIFYLSPNNVLDIQDLTLKIEESLDDDRLQFSSIKLSQLQQLKKLNIQISHIYQESIINSLFFLGIPQLIGLVELTIQFNPNIFASSSGKTHYCKPHFCQSISKLTGLKKLNLLISIMNPANVSLLLDSIDQLANLNYLGLHFSFPTETKIEDEEKFGQLFRLKQLHQLFLQVPKEKVFNVSSCFAHNDLENLELLTHLSLKYKQKKNYFELTTLFSAILTLRNLEHLKIEIAIEIFNDIKEGTVLNPLINEKTFGNLSKLQSLKISLWNWRDLSLKISKQIWKVIPYLKNIQILELNFPGFQLETNENELQEILISKLTSLQYLNIFFPKENNQVILGVFLFEACKLPNLRRLISYNKIERSQSMLLKKKCKYLVEIQQLSFSVFKEQFLKNY